MTEGRIEFDVDSAICDESVPVAAVPHSPTKWYLGHFFGRHSRLATPKLDAFRITGGPNDQTV